MRILLIPTVVAIAICILIVPGTVQASSLTQGSVINITSATCSGSSWLSTASCYTATITGCANAHDLNFTYGLSVPSSPKGVIVYFEGGEGTSAAAEAGAFYNLVYYVQQGFAVVQIAWATAWQATWDPTATYSGPPPANMQYAGCRPATFLQYIYDHLYTPTVLANNSLAGMCAEGFSMGSAQIAYSLAYYGADLLLDSVELASGPPASDIKLGCETDVTPPDEGVCGVVGAVDPWCRMGGDSPWNESPTYPAYDANYLGIWTASTAAGVPCAGSVNSSSYDSTWKAQSIVDASPGATPTFTYTHTYVSGWLCNKHGGPTNASTAQAEVFNQQLTSIPSFNVYSVDNCQGDEGVINTSTAVPGFHSVLGSFNGQYAIEYDMAGFGTSINAQCTKHH